MGLWLSFKVFDFVLNAGVMLEKSKSEGKTELSTKKIMFL